MASQLSASTAVPMPARSRAEQLVRRILMIPERPPEVSVRSANSAFQRSMAISALRCTLTYVVFPIVVPLVGFSAGVGPVVGIVIGTIALACDVFTIRRFFLSEHRWRWPVSAVVAGVAVLLLVLLIEDIAELV